MYLSRRCFKTLPMKVALAFVAVMSLVLGGCQTPGHRAARLQAGMSRSEVFALLGPPMAAVHNGSLEVLHFDLTQRDRGAPHSVSDSCYVIFGRDRRVQSFGRN